jgi:hypothetical protein
VIHEEEAAEEDEVDRESLRRLTGSPADPALQEVAGAAATRPPVCEQTNFIAALDVEASSDARGKSATLEERKAP